MSLRLVFMGTPDFAVPTLLELAGRGYDIAAVYTRAPQPAGRGMASDAVRRRTRGAALGLPVLTPTTLRSRTARSAIRARTTPMPPSSSPMGLFCRSRSSMRFRSAAFNLHASLLPRWRGAAPINRAIMAGDPETGVTVMQMEAGLDTGPIAMAERMPIGADTTAGDLHDQLAALGADLMVRALGALERGC